MRCLGRLAAAMGRPRARARRLPGAPARGASGRGRRHRRPALTAAAEEALESQLARHGLDIYDERGILELRLRVDAFLAAAADGIGRGWSDQVEYTSSNVEIKAGQAMGRLSGELAGSIAEAWTSYRGAAAR